MAGVLPVEKVPVTELLLCGVCRDVVVQVDKLWEEIFYNLSSHHCRGFSRESIHKQTNKQIFELLNCVKTTKNKMIVAGYT